ncbi:CHAT domain-containing WD40 repeat protein [Terrabacter sp. LjRoot27]|uniref:CHAT domain-containing WD40 repeat protein n=1 Tax=Terrabacter sp. LjRoot27 TaxID=3342306 RepID=UPI003F502B43
MASEIELEISPGDDQGEFAVRVLRAASGGEPREVMRLDVGHLLAGRDALENAVLLSTVSARRLVPVEEEQLRDVGQRLFDALFQGTINGAYRASMMVAQRNGERLRIVLRLNAPGLAALPWEAMWDPEVESYTCMREPLVRHVPAPYTLDPLEVVAPLRILGLTASPRGLPELDVEAEQEHLSTALARPIEDGLIEIQWLRQATWDRVHDLLLSGQWHVVHFVGHGDYDVEAEQGVIALVGPDGRKDLVDAERLATLLGEAEPTPRLVVLNSCSSGEAGSQDLFSGTAAALVRSGISAVAAMQFTISDDAALRFARGFYTALAHGRDIASAIRAGRIEILGAPRSLEWVTPVLYLRGDNARLFDLRRPANHPLSGSTLAPPSAGRPEAIARAASAIPAAQLHAIYLSARAELRAQHFSNAVSLFDEVLTLESGYRNAADLRADAARHLALEEAYQRAAEAERAMDWLAAAQGYGEVIASEPGYRDAAIRAAACQKAQEVNDLRDELRYHSEAGNWQAVIEVDDELAVLDPGAVDPDGLTSRARREMADVSLHTDPQAVRRGPSLDAESTQVNALRARLLGDLLILEARRTLDESAGVHVTPPPTSGTVREGVARAAGTGGSTGAAPAVDAEVAPAQPTGIAYALVNVHAFGWSPDGATIAIASDASKLHVYDRDLKWVSSFRAGGWTRSVYSCAFSPDGTQVAAGSNLPSVRVWGVADGTLRQEFEAQAPVLGVCFSRGGDFVASVAQDGVVRVWALASGEQVLEMDHTGPVSCASFSRDMTLLATGSARGLVRIWDVGTGEPVAAPHRDLANAYAVRPITSVALSGGVSAFSRTAFSLAVADTSNVVHVWDVRSGERLLSVHQSEPICSVALSHDGQLLATGGAHGQIGLWNVPSGTAHMRCTSDGGDVMALAFDPHDMVLATGAGLFTRLWRTLR